MTVNKIFKRAAEHNRIASIASEAPPETENERLARQRLAELQYDREMAAKNAEFEDEGSDDDYENDEI